MVSFLLITALYAFYFVRSSLSSCPGFVGHTMWEAALFLALVLQGIVKEAPNAEAHMPAVSIEEARTELSMLVELSIERLQL